MVFICNPSYTGHDGISVKLIPSKYHLKISTPTVETRCYNALPIPGYFYSTGSQYFPGVV